MTKTLRLGKAGKNVLTSTDPNDFIIHSQYNSFFVLAQGNLTSQSVNADPKTFTIAHGLSYIPAVFGFVKYPDGYVALPGQGQKGSTYQYKRRFDIEVDSTNIYFIVYQGGTGTFSVDIAYFVFNSDI